MFVSVHRSQSDCTNNGASSKHWNLMVFTTEDEGEAYKKANQGRAGYRPVFVLEQHYPGSCRVRPLKSDKPTGHAGPMFGGNYCDGDSTFKEAVKKVLGGTHPYGAVPIHDRFESAELNRSY